MFIELCVEDNLCNAYVHKVYGISMSKFLILKLNFTLCGYKNLLDGCLSKYLGYTKVGLVLLEKYILIIRTTPIKITLWLIYLLINLIFFWGGGLFLKSLLFHM